MDSDDDLDNYPDSDNETDCSNESDDHYDFPELESGDNAQVEDFSYEILNPEQIVQHMVDCIKDVNQVLQIPATTTRILLNHFRWDKEKLMERYYIGDQQKLFEEAHVIPPQHIAAPPPPKYAGKKSVGGIGVKGGSRGSSSAEAAAGPSSQDGTKPGREFRVSSKAETRMKTKTDSRIMTQPVPRIQTKPEPSVQTKPQPQFQRKSHSSPHGENGAVGGEILCDICLIPMPVSAMTGLECGHEFCTLCWTEYLTTKIMDEGMGQKISCAAHGCDILVDDMTVMKLVSDPKVKLKYQQHITNSFVDCNLLMRWCPAADCIYAAKVSYSDAKPVECKCGHLFCFSCGNNWHDPVKCFYLKKWIKKCDDDSETSNWIAANTRECPKCHVTIEKDGGCNHMVCKQQNCKADFCWVCLGPWEPHGSSWYNCNRFDEDDAKKARDAQEKSRAALARYLFYCNRYMNHMQSLKFEHKLYASVRQKMEEMQQHNMSWIEVQFLKKAVDVLTQCRSTLMYTYVFAFYLKRNNQSHIFEDNQKDLENATEQLSEYLEREITSDILVDIKQKVQDKSRYCENRRAVLLSHCHEGYEKEFWEYQASDIIGL